MIGVLALLVVTLGTITQPKPVQAQSGGPVNVPVAALVIDCPGIAPQVTDAQFWYVNLDGEVAMRRATVANDGLTYIDGFPSVVIRRLSINWWNGDSLFRLFLRNGNTIDVYIYPGDWYREPESGSIFHIAGC
jgi:hypothetical protein